MKATSIKQIKFNRGQVSDLLSERVDMGLQNACGTVYDNIYINRYGQIQQAPNCIFCTGTRLIRAAGFPCHILGLFNTGANTVLAIGYDNAGGYICVFGPFPKTQIYADMAALRVTVQLTSWSGIFPQNIKFLQFGYNVLLYGQDYKPILLNITPDATNGWTVPTLTVKENYFDGAFDNIYVRGINTETPSGFTVPTSGEYKIADQKSVTTQMIVTLDRNGAGSAFTQDLVGQVLQCNANGGALQIRGFVDADTLTAYVLSPLVILNASDSYIKIPFDNNQSTWVFGYQHPYGDTAGTSNSKSYPDSAVYVNQRLIFGGNDYHGSLISASRIGVINDFDPETATESDAFTTSIASKDFCRIVDFTVSNGELRIACSNGEYAMSLANLTPTKSLSGFDLRSEVGIAKDTAICDCGGLTAYVSRDGDSIYGTQFSLLRDRYQPISLTSQTKDVINECIKLQYLTHRPNSESNCLVGLNSDSSLAIGSIDLNAGLISLVKFLKREYKSQVPGGKTHKIVRVFAIENCLWGVLAPEYGGVIQEQLLVRFTLNEMFDLPVWMRTTGTHAGTFTVSGIQGNLYDVTKMRALYRTSEGNYEIITPVSKTTNGDGTMTINFADDIDLTKIICAGFVRQSDWRSVEIGVGMATRELNKQIIKLESVIEPLQVTGGGRFAGTVLTPDQARKFIKLTRSKDVETIDVDNLSTTSYTESADLVWRRAFDNPSREMHYGVSSVMPFLVKSITCTVQYDECQ